MLWGFAVEARVNNPDSTIVRNVSPEAASGTYSVFATKSPDRRGAAGPGAVKAVRVCDVLNE